MYIYFQEGPEDPELEEEWNRFYNTQHAPIEVRGRSQVIRAYRYVALEKKGVAPKYLTIYEMETADGLSKEDETKELEQAHDTEWFRKIGGYTKLRGTGQGNYMQIYPEE